MKGYEYQKMIKTLHIITGLHTGGAEMMLYKLLCAIDREQFDPVVISLMDKGTIGLRIEELGIPVCVVKLNRGIPTPSGFLGLLKLIKMCDPDLIQSWMYHANLAAILALSVIRNRVPVIWNIRHSLHELDKERLLTRLVIRMNSLLSGKPAAIVYNSETSIKQHREFGFQALHDVVIPNGFDTMQFKPNKSARRQFRMELGLEEAILIGHVARYHPMKDHECFLRAAALLSCTVPEARFVMAGREVDSKNVKLICLIEKLNLRGRVFLLGERDDVSNLTAALDISTSSSAWGEAFPNVLGEAMACGVPCVATNVGDSERIVAETGKIVPIRDPEAIAQAWLDILELGYENKQELGRLARERTEKLFSLDAVVEQYQQLYLEVVY